MCLSKGKLIELTEKVTCYKIVLTFPESRYDEKTHEFLGYGKSYHTPFCNAYIPDEVITGKRDFVAEGDSDLRGDADNLRVGKGFIHSYANVEDALSDMIHHFYRIPDISGRKYELWECEIAPGTFCFKGQFEYELTPVYASGRVRFTRCLAGNEADAWEMEKKLLEKKLRLPADCAHRETNIFVSLINKTATN